MTTLEMVGGIVFLLYMLAGWTIATVAGMRDDQ